MNELDPNGAPPAQATLPAKSSRRYALLATATLAGLAGAGVAWWRFAPGTDVDLAGFWDRTFPTPEGPSLALSSLRGRPLLINFWATWCPPCVEELPLLSAFYAENKANGWQLLGLAVDQPEPVKRFMVRTPIAFPVGMAGMAGVDLTRQLGNAAGGLPFTVVFGADGRLVDRKIGRVQPADLARWKKQLT
ncbi:TlpA family protein disulfide reductase [Ottowia sp.]|uniref:TlpA family protein disulfide reductase n=1 Tax=Ottowia sp. TaxID=1898956 RepID=UPI003A86CC5F